MTVFSRGTIEALALQPDGRLLAAGTAVHPDVPDPNVPDNANFGLARFGSNGSPDVSFGESGKVSVDMGTGSEGLADVAVGPDGRIVAVGQVSRLGGYNFAVVQLNSDGRRDAQVRRGRANQYPEPGLRRQSGRAGDGCSHPE